MSNTFYKETDDIIERYELACERISTIKEDKDLPDNLQGFFNLASLAGNQNYICFHELSPALKR